MPQLTCPLCGLMLAQVQSVSWGCENNHTFDTAKEGYINLLPVQNKRSLNPGDDKLMVRARQRFLNDGFYASISKFVNQTVIEHAKKQTTLLKSTFGCLDAGCGEGYYIRQLRSDYAQSVDTLPELNLIGLDVSKWAALAAAKQDKSARYLVASNASIPLSDESVDVVLCMFGFPSYGEFRRVLKPNGLLIKVDAGSGHLQQLKDVIYENKPTQNTENKEAQGSASMTGFEKGQHRTVQYQQNLTNKQQIADLFSMTPHAHRTAIEGRERLFQMEQLEVSIDIDMKFFEKTTIQT